MWILLLLAAIAVVNVLTFLAVRNTFRVLTESHKLLVQNLSTNDTLHAAYSRKEVLKTQEQIEEQLQHIKRLERHFELVKANERKDKDAMIKSSVLEGYVGGYFEHEELCVELRRQLAYMVEGNIRVLSGAK
jgi:hypothetical protein